MKENKPCNKQYVHSMVMMQKEKFVEKKHKHI